MDSKRPGQTVCLVVLVHEGKRVKVQVAVEVYARSVGKQMGGVRG
jgi:hypothetical protein